MKKLIFLALLLTTTTSTSIQAQSLGEDKFIHLGASAAVAFMTTTLLKQMSKSDTFAILGTMIILGSITVAQELGDKPGADSGDAIANLLGAGLGAGVAISISLD